MLTPVGSPWHDVNGTGGVRGICRCADHAEGRVPPELALRAVCRSTLTRWFGDEVVASPRAAAGPKYLAELAEIPARRPVPTPAYLSQLATHPVFQIGRSPRRNPGDLGRGAPAAPSSSVEGGHGVHTCHPLKERVFHQLRCYFQPSFCMGNAACTVRSRRPVNAKFRCKSWPIHRNHLLGRVNNLAAPFKADSRPLLDSSSRDGRPSIGRCLQHALSTRCPRDRSA
jgi:hypothetical protein